MRNFAKLLLVVIVTTMLAACAAPTPEVVEKEVVVEKPVVETVLVEKEVVVEKEVPVTIEVEKEKIVEKEVVKTVEVEKEVVVEKEVPAAPAPGKTEIGFMTICNEDRYGPLIEEAMAEYEGLHPNIDITWIDVCGPKDEWFLANLMAGTLPDILDFNWHWGLGDWIYMDALEPLDDYLSTDQRRQYFDGPWEAAMSGGKSYGIPWYMGGFVFWYNEDLFEQAGLDPDKPPTTFEEELAAAKQITEKTGVPGISFYTRSYQMVPLLVQEGVEFLDQEGNVAINSPKHVEVLKMWADAYQAGHIVPEAVVGADTYDDVNWFISGAAAMMYRDHGWLKLKPDDFHPRVASALQGAGKATNTLNLHYFILAKQSRHPQEAVNWALFFTGKDYTLKAIDVYIRPFGNKATLEHPAFSKEPATLAEVANTLQLETFEDASAIPLIPHWRRLMAVLEDQWTACFLGEITAEEAVANVEADWNKIIGQ
jgi:putative chitobiose transport system substrate-binding protein